MAPDDADAAKQRLMPWPNRSRHHSTATPGDPASAMRPDADASTSRRASALVSVGILASRVSGLVRERVMSHFLGTSLAADAFTAAARIPNLLQRLLGEGVLSASFIPVHARLLAEGRERDAGRLAGAVFGLLAALTGVLAIVGIVFAEPLTSVVAVGFRSRPEAFGLTVRLVRIMFPAVGLLVLSAWCVGMLNSHRRFFLSYVAPAALNVVQIGVLVVGGLAIGAELAAASDGAAQRQLATWLAVGTVAGGVVQFGIQLPTVLRVSRGLRPSLRLDVPGVRQVLRSSVSVIGARGVVQMSAYVQLLLASFLAAGALASLRYAQVLHLLPVSLFGTAVAAAELPELARTDRLDTTTVTSRLRRGLTRVTTFVVPSALGYLVLGDVVTGMVFQTGAFGTIDTLAVWIVLGGYTVGLLASTSSRLLQSALYGMGDTRTPARAAVVRILISVALGLVLMVQLDRFAITADGLRQLGGIPAFGPLPVEVRDATAGQLVRLGAAGLSVAAGVSAWFEYAMLRRAVRDRVGSFTPSWHEVRHIVISSCVAFPVAVAARPLARLLPPLPAGVLVVGATATIYLVVAATSGSADARHLLRTLLLVGRRARRRHDT